MESKSHQSGMFALLFIAKGAFSIFATRLERNGGLRDSRKNQIKLFTKPPQKFDHGLKLNTFILTRRDGSSYEGP